MLITTSGVLIRTRVREIREMGRATQGVTLINLDKGDKLAGLSRIAEPEETEDSGSGIEDQGSEESGSEEDGQ